MSYRNLLKFMRAPMRNRSLRDNHFFNFGGFGYPQRQDYFMNHRDPIDEAFDRMAEAFDIITDPYYTAPSLHYGKEKGSKKQKQIKQGEEGQQQESKQEKEAIMKTNKSEDVEAASESQTVDTTYERAHKLFDKLAKSNEKPILELDEKDELLQGRNDFEDLMNYSQHWGGKGSVSGSTYESSTIFKDGKAVRVTKFSKLNPDGTVRTEVNQEYVNEKGDKDCRKWVKEEDALGRAKVSSGQNVDTQKLDTSSSKTDQSSTSTNPSQSSENNRMENEGGRQINGAGKVGSSPTGDHMTSA